MADGTNVGKVYFSIEVDNRNQVRSVVSDALGGAQREANRLSGSVSRTTQTATKGFSSMAKVVGGVTVAVVALKKAFNFAAESIKLASDLQEVQNVVSVTFGELTGQVDAFAKNAITSIGLSEKVAKQYVGTFGAMSKSFGFTNEEAFGLSKSLTKLTGDVASFYNLSTDEAYTKLKSVFTGETESLKDLGVVMTQTALDSYALANGFNKTTKEMTEQEKVFLRYQFVMDKLSGAQGDFMRTQDGWANQTRVLALQFDSLKAAIGDGLIVVLTPAIKMLNTLISKLVVAAQAFSAFVKTIFGVKEEDTSAGIAGDIAAAGDAADNLAGGTEETAKNLAAAKKSLMGFDKLNKLADNSSSGSSGGAGISSMDFSSLIDPEAESEPLNNVGIQLGNLTKLLEQFKLGFSSVFNPDDFKPVIENIKLIGQAIKDIFTDKVVVDSASGFASKVVFSLGQATGAVASVGTTIAQFFTGSIARYLDANKEFISGKISSMFDTAGRLAQHMGNYAASIADIFTVFKSDAAQEIGKSITESITNPLLTLMDLTLKFKTDVFDVITGPIVDNVDKIKQAFQGLFDASVPIFQSIADTATHMCEVLTNLYDEHIAPLMKSLRDGISELLGTFLDAWNTYIQPVLNELGVLVADVFTNYIKPVTDKIAKIIGQIIDIVKILWEKWLQPLFNWHVQKVMPIIGPLIQGIGNIVITTVKSVISIIGGLLDVLGGILDFILGVFTGDWKRAWEGVKSIFKGVWDSLVTIVKTPLNLIIDLINTVTSTISNFLKIKLPEWAPGGLAGKEWGITIPKIPKLAMGGYVKPNNPQLAIIGDNKREGEIVAPESKITEAVNQALLPFINTLVGALRGPQTAMAGGDIVIPVYIGNEMLDQYIVNANTRNTYRSGR